MAWVRQYSAPNVVGARKLKALIFLDEKSTLMQKTVTLRFYAPSFFWGGDLEAACDVHSSLESA